MNAIIGEAVVSCYADAASLLVMVLLLLLSERLQQRKTRSLRIFFQLSLCITAACAAYFVFNALYRQPAAWCRTAALITGTLCEYLVVIIVCLWGSYVEHTLYGDRPGKNGARVFRGFLMTADLILLAVNLFTGIAFDIGADNTIEPKWPFFVMVGLNLLVFLASMVMVWRYDRKTTKVRFLRITPMVVSVVAFLLPQYFTPFKLGIVGFVIGATLLYFSMIGEIRYVDGESGLFNQSYLAYLFDLAIAGKYEARCALTMEADGDLPAALEILRDLLHSEGDVIRVEDRKFLMLSRTDSRSHMQYLSSLAEEAAERHNQGHPEDKVKITARCRLRTAEEDSFAFLRAVLEHKETGDSMRGIVSMMSELDRLDEELKLAGDIQISMLPMNFPPFPEHREFELYASMTPAKEVGGDFYDFFLVDDDHLALVIADVSGKGIPAALFMMVSKTLIKNQLMSGAAPAQALERVNLQLCERNASMMFVTVWLAVVELSTGRGLAVNAGHEKPALRRANGSFELLEYKHNAFIGVIKKAKYQDREFQLQPGDCLFVYTDGVPEATDAAMAMFGEKRLTETLNEDPDREPEALIRGMHAAVDAFAAGTPQFDDITMLCFKYCGAERGEGEAR